MRNPKVKIGDHIFNTNIQKWERVEKVSPLRSGITGYARFMRENGITHQVETASGFVICITPQLKIKGENLDEK